MHGLRQESHTGDVGNVGGTAGSTQGRTRPRGLSLGRVSELVADLISRRFYGKISLHFEAGHIVCAKLEESIKE